MDNSRALVVQGSRTRTALYGTRAQLAATTGNVEGYLTLAACDVRAGTATYALRIDNGSASTLRARMTCVRLRGEIVPAYPLDVTVAPFSRCETLLPVRMDQVGPYDRAVVAVDGQDVAFSIEAPAPVPRRRKISWVTAAAAASVFTIAASFGAAAATPSLAMLAAPSRVFAGAPVEVPYAFAGWASLQYAFKTRDGRQLAAGLLSAHQGTLRFNVPTSAGSAMVLNVSVVGPFGVRSKKQNIEIAGVAPRHVAMRRDLQKGQPQSPAISEFALTTPQVHAGGTVSFSYATNAQDGEIWLIDDTGRLWAKGSITADGHTTLDVPQGAAGRQLRAVMHARSGSQDAVAGVAVTVLPGAVVSQSAAQGPVTQKTVTAPATLSLSQSSPAPGETITVSIGGAHGDSSITLNDASGNSVETGDIAEGQTAMVLTAPSTKGTYYVVATVMQGVAQQTLVQKLNVH